MIYEISQMIDLLDKFYEDVNKRVGLVGAIAGTQIEEFIMNSATKYVPFQRILILNGCQDYIAVMKEPLKNVKYWADILYPVVADSAIPIDPFQPKILNPEPEWRCDVDMKMLSNFDSCIIFNAHLIPSMDRNMIVDKFCGKVLLVIDPVEMRSSLFEMEKYIDPDLTPTLVDTLDKVTPMIAMARAAIGYETRSINKRAPGVLNQVAKMNKRSIGKMDDKQYIVPSFPLREEIQRRQIDQPFKKNQKFILTLRDKNIFQVRDSSNNTKATLTRHSMIILTHIYPIGNMMDFRLYNGKESVVTTPIKYDVYNPNPLAAKLLKGDGKLSVIPANVIDTNEMMYHRYNHAVYVSEGYPIRPVEKYSLLKNCNNLTIVEGN